MKHNLEGVGVGSDDHQVGDAPIQGLGNLVGTLFDLLLRGTVGHQIVDLGHQTFVSKRLGAF